MRNKIRIIKSIIKYYNKINNNLNWDQSKQIFTLHRLETLI